MFYPNEMFPFTTTLEQNWQLIRNEALRLQDW